jgi:hypothetical protein
MASFTKSNWISWRILNNFLLYRVGLLAPRPTPIPEDHISVFISPKDRAATHFSRLLRHAWVTVGLFLFPGHHTGNFHFLYYHEVNTVSRDVSSPASYSGGLLFESRSGGWLSWGLSWYYSISPGKWWNRTSKYEGVSKRFRTESQWNIRLSLVLLVEKQHKGLWQQNSLDSTYAMCLQLSANW